MYGKNVSLKFGGPITPVVKKIMIVTGAVFIIQQLAGLFSQGSLEMFFGLHHAGLVYEFKIWQLFTYMFLHGGWFHVIINLVVIWMFAGELERVWGSKLFLRYYIYTGIGAGIFIALLNYISFTETSRSIPTIGASGSIFALLLAYGLTWPNREILLYFIIPIKIKYFVIIIGLIAFFGTISSLSGNLSGISHVGHLGGLISGFIFIMLRSKRSSKTTTSKADKSVIDNTIKKARLKKKQKEIDTRIKAKKIIDKLLEKIARKGMSSLTPDERKDLEWARKHYYPEGDDTLH